MVLKESLVTQSILVVCYSVTLYRSVTSVRLDFVSLISSLMVVAATTWMLEQWCILAFTQSTSELYGSGDLNCSQAESSLHAQCLTIAFLQWVNISSYNVANWVFVMKYWSLSCILQKQIEHEIVNAGY